MSEISINGVMVDEHVVYNEGYDAAEKGLGTANNPYTGVAKYAEGVWEDGWNDYMDNESD